MEIRDEPRESPDDLRRRARGLEQIVAIQKTAFEAILKDLQRYESHPPLTAAQMRAKHQKVPPGYDHAEALFHWANDVLGPRRDARDAAAAAIRAVEADLANVNERIAALLRMPCPAANGAKVPPAAAKAEPEAERAAKPEREWTDADERRWHLDRRRKLLRRRREMPRPLRREEPPTDIAYEDFAPEPDYVVGVQVLQPGVIIVNETNIRR